MKLVIEQTGVEIDTVCVDSPKIKNALLNDDEYGIDEVPSVLVIRSTGHEVYVGDKLETWFEQLLENINNLSQESPSQSTSSTVGPTGNVGTPIVTEITTPVQTPIQTSKEVKKEGATPAELAAMMMAQREAIQEEEDENKPF